MKNHLFAFILLLASNSGYCQATYLKRLNFNSESSSYYVAPEDSNLKFIDASISPDGNTFFHCGLQRGTTSIFKVDLQGNILSGAGGGYISHLSQSTTTALHATPDGGCIYANNSEAWSMYYFSYSEITKIDGSGHLSWNILLPSDSTSSISPVQEVYDIAILPNGNYACLALDSTYILDSLGNLIRTLNFQGPGKILGFSNGDMYLECSSFRGRMDTNGNPIWNNNSSLLHHDTTLYKLSGTTMNKLDGMTGAIISSAPYTPSSLGNILMMSDGGWCNYNSTSIKRFDSNGVLKWHSTITLPKFGMNYIAEQSDHTIITGGTYLSLRVLANEYDFSAFIATIDSTGHSVMDSTTQTWPGDANDDGIVEFSDVIYIALAQGATGPNRVDSSLHNYNDWQYHGGFEMGDIAIDFPGHFPNGVNLKQCDVYTDGKIDSLDITDLASNISIFTYYPFWRRRSPESENSILPYFSVVPDRDSAFSGDTVRIYFILGDNGIAVDSIFGLAFTLSSYPSQFWRQGIVVNSNALNSDLGSVSDLRFGGYSQVALYFARRDLQNAYNVQDTIGYIDYKIFDTLSYHSMINFPVGSFQAITASGFPVDFQYNSIPLYARSIIASSQEIQLNKISLSPNPASNQLTLDKLPEGDLSIQIFNTEGKLCYSEKISDTTSYQINLSNFTPGLYQLIMRNGNSLSVSRKFVKE